MPCPCTWNVYFVPLSCCWMLALVLLTDPRPCRSFLVSPFLSTMLSRNVYDMRSSRGTPTDSLHTPPSSRHKRFGTLLKVRGRERKAYIKVKPTTSTYDGEQQQQQQQQVRNKPRHPEDPPLMAERVVKKLGHTKSGQPPQKIPEVLCYQLRCSTNTSAELQNGA